MEIPQHIRALIEKYLSASITKEELVQLNDWYHKFEDSQAEVDMDMDLDKDAAMNTAQPEDGERQLSEAIYNRLMNSTELQPPIRKINNWKTYAAAIVLLLLITGAGYLLLNRHQISRDKIILVTNNKPSKGDLAPGGNKAILTLADGSVVVLDSLQNGTLGQQGGVEVQKLASGALSYNRTSNLSEPLTTVFNEIATPRGGTYQITLSDGTRVWLNAATELRFPTSFPGKTREVSLKGEAYFEVAKNAGQPFLVHTDKQTIRVLGTHFNVNAYEDEPVYRTTLLEGKVRVISKRSPTMEATLSPGQQATLHPSGRLSITLHPDLEQVTGWKEGNFVFHSTDFKTILRLIGRWYNADIDYQGTDNPVFTGQISKKLPVSKVFALLSMTNEIHYTIKGNSIIVSTH